MRAALVLCLFGGALADWPHEYINSYKSSFTWYRPIRNESLSLPSETSVEAAAILAKGRVVWVVGRSQEFHLFQDEEPSLPAASALCGVRVGPERVWVPNGPDPRGELSPASKAFPKAAFLSLAFQCVDTCCGSHCCAVIPEMETFVISSVLFLLLPLALVCGLLGLEAAAPALWARLWAWTPPLDEKLNPFKRLGSFRGSFMTAASQVPPPPTMKRVKFVNETEQSSGTVVWDPPLTRCDASAPARLNILH